MARVLKYSIPFDGDFHTIEAAEGSILKCAFQKKDFCFWIRDLSGTHEKPTEVKRTFTLIPTGASFDCRLGYRGSAQSTEFPGLEYFVLHLFEDSSRIHK